MINNHQSDITFFQMYAGVGRHRAFVKVMNMLLNWSVLYRTSSLLQFNFNALNGYVLDVLLERKTSHGTKPPQTNLKPT